MRKAFRCDCQCHIVEISYEKATKYFDWEDIAIAIYDVYNPDTGRKYKRPKLIADIILFDNHYSTELEDFFNFILKIIKNRKKAKVHKGTYNKPSGMDKVMNNAIKELTKMHKEEAKKYKEEKAKRKSRK